MRQFGESFFMFFFRKRGSLEVKVLAEFEKQINSLGCELKEERRMTERLQALSLGVRSYGLRCNTYQSYQIGPTYKVLAPLAYVFS